MDSLDQLYQYAKQDPKIVNVGVRDYGGDNELWWGELAFQDAGDGLIRAYHKDEPLGVYGVNETLTILKGHQELFKR